MNEILTALAEDLGVLSEAQEAAEGRDTSLVHWRFMVDVLRHMPEQDPAAQAVIDPFIVGTALSASCIKLCVTKAAWYAALATSPNSERTRQREVLLRMIAECPTEGESE